MKTITAKELRDNLGEIVKRVSAGEHIRVTYREKPAFTLVSQTTARSKLAPGSQEAIREFLKRARIYRAHNSVPVHDPNKSIKELYHEMLDNDPKYKV